MFALPVLALTWVAAGSARADDAPLRLTWTAPPGCPSSDEVRSAIARASSADAGAAHAAVLEAEAHVEQQLTSWRVHLRTRRGASTGEREIEARTCSAIADATAVVLALALVSPRTAPQSEAAALPPQAPLERDAPAPRPPSNGGHALALGASATADVATLPAPVMGGSATLAWTPGRARIELDAGRSASQSRTVASSNAGARFSLTALGGRGCWAALRSGTFDVSPCAGADLHLVSASGYGADANYDASAQWVTADGGALARMSIASWLAVRTRVEAVVPLARPSFVVENEGTVHRPPSFGAAASLGVEVLFL